MMRYLVSRVIQDTFEAGFRRDENVRGMLLDFKISTKPNESGYRHMQMLLLAPTNYVQIWVRETWDLWETPDSDMAGTTAWALAMDHDSCWRDAIQEVLGHYEDRISTWGGPLRSWYESIEVPKDLNKSNRYQRPQR